VRRKRWTIAGGWVASLLTEEMCCQQDELGTDIILLSIHIPQRGTLNRLRYDVIGFVYRKGARPIRGATIYIVRIDKQGGLAMARPCIPCMSELMDHQVKRVIYSIPGGYMMEDL